METGLHWICPDCNFINSFKHTHCNACCNNSGVYFTQFQNSMGNNQNTLSEEELFQKIYIDDENDSLSDKNITHEFTICTFNIWCPYYNDSHPKGVEAKCKKDWMQRHGDILKILCSENDQKHQDMDKLDAINADIYCLQEFWCANKDFMHLYKSYFEPKNYGIYYLKRSAKYKPDGVAMLINHSKFKLVKQKGCEYKKSNRVAMMVELEHMESGCHICVGNTHFTFPTMYNGSSRKYLCEQFLDFMNANVSKNASLSILCGDYNCDIEQTESRLCLDDGFKSSFHVCNGNNNDNNPQKNVSHFTHNKESVFVDHIFYKRQSNENNAVAIKAVSSYLYPQNVATHKWPNKKEWNLSDHRPIVSTFQLQSITQPTPDTN